jgi:hypothetical protein
MFAQPICSSYLLFLLVCATWLLYIMLLLSYRDCESKVCMAANFELQPREMHYSSRDRSDKMKSHLTCHREPLDAIGT